MTSRTGMPVRRSGRTVHLPGTRLSELRWTEEATAISEQVSTHDLSHGDARSRSGRTVSLPGKRLSGALDGRGYIDQREEQSSDDGGDPGGPTVWRLTYNPTFARNPNHAAILRQPPVEQKSPQREN